MVDKEFWPKKITDNWSGKWKRVGGNGKYRLVREGTHEKKTKGKRLHFNEIKSAYGIQAESW